jgi:hypothetical protein
MSWLVLRWADEKDAPKKKQRNARAPGGPLQSCFRAVCTSLGEVFSLLDVPQFQDFNRPLYRFVQNNNLGWDSRALRGDPKHHRRHSQKPERAEKRQQTNRIEQKESQSRPNISDLRPNLSPV